MPSLRQQLRNQRRALSSEQRRTASQDIAALITADESIQSAKQLAFYLAVDGELDPAPIMDWCHQQQKQIYLPVLGKGSQQGKLLFLEYSPGETRLVQNQYNILEPEYSNSRCVNPLQLDMIFCPLVAFNRQGHRMGMGKGYYDKTFAGNHLDSKQAKLAGLAYAFQEQKFSAKPWDVPLTAIYTEKEKIEVISKSP